MGCLIGGMTELLSIIFSHESDQVRQFERETSPASKSSVFSCLTSWLKADNFEGKRRFISEQDGLDFLVRLVCEAGSDAEFNTRLNASARQAWTSQNSPWPGP